MIPIGMSDVIEILKKISQAAEKFKSKEINEAIIELQSKVMSVQQEIIKLNAENEAVKQKLQEKEQHNMQPDNGAYWDVKADGTKEGPFCGVCWEKDRKAIRFKKVLVGSYSPSRDNTYYIDSCPVCNKKR